MSGVIADLPLHRKTRTPLGATLHAVGDDLASHEGPKIVVFVTDGKETCKGDPAAEAARLAKDLKLSFGVNVIGFDVSAEERKSLEEIATAGKGKYVNAQTAKELTESLGALARRLEVEAKPAEARTSNRRAVKVLEPKIKLPPLAAMPPMLTTSGNFRWSINWRRW